MALLEIFSKKKVKKKEFGKIIVDNRERNSMTPSELMKLGYEVEWKQLPVADYIVNGIAIERKTISDLKSSIINKRIVQQLLELKQYPKHFLLIEGILDEELYDNGIHGNAFRGFLLSVVLEHRVPMIFTHDEEDSARYIDVLARRQDKKIEEIRASKIFLNKREQIQFILEGFPNVGPKAVRKLIEKFGSLNEIFNASEEELGEVLGKRAGNFRELLDKKFKRKK
jgi:ERCC4-type nuclease